MKIYLPVWCYLFLNSSILCSQNTIKAYEKANDSQFYSIFESENKIIFCDETFYQLDLKSNEIIKEYTILSSFGNIRPLGLLRTSHDRFIGYGRSYINSNSYLVSFSYDLSTNTTSVVDTANFGDYLRLNSTKPILIDKHFYIVCGMSYTSRISDAIHLVKFDEEGKIDSVFTKIKGSNPGIESLFQLKWINDIMPIGKDRIIMSGESLRLIISDLEFNVLNSIPISRWHPDTGIIYRLFRPELMQVNDSVFRAVDLYSTSVPLRVEELRYTFKFVQDSIILLSQAETSNTENHGKDKVLISSNNIDPNIYYTAADLYYDIPGTKLNIKSYFYLTKIEENKEVFHFRYGGDHFYRIQDLRQLSNGNLLIVGSVYDYFNNGYLQGFWVYIDPNGNIINASTDIRKQDVQLYPNPNKGQFVIESENQIDEVQIYNTQGQLLEIFKGSKSETMDVNMSKYGSGIYHLKIVSDKRVVAKTVSIVR